MTKWDERVSNHPFLSNLHALNSALDRTGEVSITADAVIDLERLRQVAGYIATVLRTTDPALIPLQILSAMEPDVRGITSEVNAFVSNGNPGHLSNANGQADALLAHAYRLPAPSQADQLESAKEVVTSIRRSAGQYIGALERDHGSLNEKLLNLEAKATEVAAEISSQKLRLDQAISEYQLQFSQSESKRREEFSLLIQELSISQKSLESDSKGQFDGIAASANTAITDFKKGSDDSVRIATNAFSEKARLTLDALEKYRQQAQELLQVIGSTGMAGDYQKAAKSAKWSKWIWQGLTVASMCGLIGFAIHAYDATSDNSINISAIWVRLFVALTFGALAVFANRQAESSERNEQRNRRYQLELSSIDPYLSGLPEDIRIDVKKRLAEKLFGNTMDLGPLAAENNKTTGTTLDVLKMAVEVIQDLTKKS